MILSLYPICWVLLILCKGILYGISILEIVAWIINGSKVEARYNGKLSSLSVSSNAIDDIIGVSMLHLRHWKLYCMSWKE